MKKRLLITSVGSLVGQNILDSLENRRDNILITGTNSVVDAANNFRCDKSYLVSEAAQTGKYVKELTKIIKIEKPDLIFPGRDDDVVILSRIREDLPEYYDTFHVGSVDFARIMDDKIESYRFAQQYNLPFAYTIQSGMPESGDKAKELIAKHGFPLIAKPRKGNGSRGIRIVVKQSQLEKIIKEEDYAIQPLIGQSNDIALDVSRGLPFFWGTPDSKLFAAQVIIEKSGKLGPMFGFISKMVWGKCERMDKYNETRLLDVVEKFAKSAIKEKWRGAFNIQLKDDPEYGFQVIEMNGRFSGGTSARYCLGFDEVGMTITDWLGKGIIPENPSGQDSDIVTKILSDFGIKQSDMDILSHDKVWEAKKR